MNPDLKVSVSDPGILLNPDPDSGCTVLNPDQIRIRILPKVLYFKRISIFIKTLSCMSSKLLQRTYCFQEKPPALHTVELWKHEFLIFLLLWGTVLACLYLDPDSVTDHLNQDLNRILNTAVNKTKYNHLGTLSIYHGCSAHNNRHDCAQDGGVVSRPGRSRGGLSGQPVCLVADPARLPAGRLPGLAPWGTTRWGFRIVAAPPSSSSLLVSSNILYFQINYRLSLLSKRGLFLLLNSQWPLEARSRER